MAWLKQHVVAMVALVVTLVSSGVTMKVTQEVGAQRTRALEVRVSELDKGRERLSAIMHRLDRMEAFQQSRKEQLDTVVAGRVAILQRLRENEKTTAVVVSQLLSLTENVKEIAVRVSSWGKK